MVGNGLFEEASKKRPEEQRGISQGERGGKGSQASETVQRPEAGEIWAVLRTGRLVWLECSE